MFAFSGSSRGRIPCIATRLPLLLVLACGTARPARGQTMDWNNPSGGWWNMASNWTPAQVPDQPGESARVPAALGATTLQLDISPTIDWLAIESGTAVLQLYDKTLTTSAGLTNAGRIMVWNGAGTINGPLSVLISGSIWLGDSDALNLGGPTLVNDGAIVVNQPISWWAELNCIGNVLLSGSGAIQLNNGGTNARLSTSPGCTLTQAAGHTIHGRGQVCAALENGGLVRADVNGQALELLTNPKGNTGTLMASGGGLLDLIGIAVTQSGGGQIVADAGSVRLRSGAVLSGGMLTSLSGGALYNWEGSNTLDDAALTAGTWFGIRGTTGPLHVTGTALTNDGTLVVNCEPTWSAAAVVDEPLTLQGSGQVVLNSGGGNAQLNTAEGVSLTQAAGHTIRGRGQINAALINHGAVIADVPTQALELRTNAKLNNGLMKAGPGAYLDLLGITVTQTPAGEIVADGEDSQVRLRGDVTVSGGVLASASGGGLLHSDGSNTLHDVILADGSWLGIHGSTGPLNLTGSSFVNEGTLVVNYEPTWGAVLAVNDGLTIQGAGEIVLNSDGVNAQLNTAADKWLTQAAAHTIRGRGQINAALVNDGTVTADVPDKALELRTNAKTNNDLMQAVGGACLELYGVTVTQSPDALLLANGAGSQVRLRNGATLSGGTLASANGGAVLSDAGANTLHEITLAEGSWLGIHGSTGPLNLTGSHFINDGTLVVNYEPTWSAALAVSDNLTIQGSGEVRLNSGGATAQLNTAEGVSLTQAGEHAIRGLGQINAALVNHGTVAADVPSKALELRTNGKTNNGLLQAVGGGYLELYGITVTQAPGALILADGTGSQVHLRNGTIISGGTLASTNGGGVLSDAGANTLDEMTLAPGTWLGIAGSTGPLNLTGTSFTNDGTVAVNYNKTWSSTLAINNDLTLQGSGEILLSQGGEGAQLNTAAGVTLTQAAGHTIRGLGQTNAALINHGAIAADVAGQWLTINPAALGVVHDGTLEVVAGSNLRINSAALFSQTGGQTIVNGQLQVTSAPLALEGGTLTGAGTITGSVANSGAAVEPGAEVGKLTISSAYTQGPDGTLLIELAGTTPGSEHDQLAVGGSAALDGALRLELAGGFVPQAGQQFVILTAGSVIGTLDADLGPGEYTITYNPKDVTVTVVHPPGDLNCDGTLDAFDIDPFVLALTNPAGYEAAYPDCHLWLADCNDDGKIDAFDIDPFVGLLTGG